MISTDNHVFIAPRVRALYEAYARAHAGVIDPLEYGQHLYQRGGQEMLQAMVQFQDVTARIHSLARRVDEIGNAIEALQEQA